VLIETIPAAFEMDEILYELRDHAAKRTELRSLGLHLQLHQEIPQPARVRAARPRARDDGPPFLKSYVDLLIQTCHRRAFTRWAAWRAQIRSRGDGRGETPRRSTQSCRTRYGRCRPVTMAPGSHIRVSLPVASGASLPGRFHQLSVRRAGRPRDAARSAHRPEGEIHRSRSPPPTWTSASD